MLTDQQMKLIETLLERQKEALSVMEALAETQFILAQALCPEVQITVSGDDGPVTIQ
jgi:hypothetical protein